MKTYQLFSEELVTRFPKFLVKRGILESENTPLAIFEHNNKLVLEDRADCGAHPMRITYDMYRLHSRYCDIWDNYNDHPFVALMGELSDAFVHDYQEFRELREQEAREAEDISQFAQVEMQDQPEEQEL